jgi:FtsH-binding integral membrane protein
MTQKPESARSIRKTALIVAAGLWFICTLMTWQLGFSLPRSALVNAVTALGGLFAWAIYHAISRQNNGIMLFAFTFGSSSIASRQLDVSLTEDVISRVGLCIILALTHIIIGLCCRDWTNSPLWNDEIHPRSTR